MFKITCISTDKDHISIFTEVCYKKNERIGMLLSDQIGAKNFRLRESPAGYRTDWHLAGDSTLIIIQKGTVRITLQNNHHLDFMPGTMFIAADNLPESVDFDNKLHGHKAEVMGEDELFAIHIKLDNWGM